MKAIIISFLFRLPYASLLHARVRYCGAHLIADAIAKQMIWCRSKCCLFIFRQLNNIHMCGNIIKYFHHHHQSVSRSGDETEISADYYLFVHIRSYGGPFKRAPIIWLMFAFKSRSQWIDIYMCIRREIGLLYFIRGPHRDAAQNKMTKKKKTTRKNYAENQNALHFEKATFLLFSPPFSVISFIWYSVIAVVYVRRYTHILRHVIVRGIEQECLLSRICVCLCVAAQLGRHRPSRMSWSVTPGLYVCPHKCARARAFSIALHIHPKQIRCCTGCRHCGRSSPSSFGPKLSSAHSNV